MKISSSALPSLLKNPISHSCYLFYGPDAGLIDERSLDVAAAFLSVDVQHVLSVCHSFLPIHLKEYPYAILEEASSLSLFSETPLRVFRLRDADDSCTSAITHYVDGNPSQTLLIVLAGALPPSSSLRRFAEKHPSIACVPCYLDTPAQLRTVISKIFQSAGKTCDSDALSFMVDHLGIDRGITTQEIQKILLFMGDSPKLMLRDVQLLLGDSQNFSLDMLLNACFSGNKAALWAHLAHIREADAFGIPLLRAMASHVTRLLTAHSFMQEGLSPADALAKLSPPVFFMHIPSMTKQLSLWSPTGLLSALGRIVSMESAFKLDSPLPAMAVERLVLHLSIMGKGRNS